MEKRDKTAAVVDGILRLTVTSSAIAAGLLIPNLLVALDKPLQKYWKHLDKRARERELRRVITYMKSRKLITANYEHGLQITDKGRARLEKTEIHKIKIKRPSHWDKKWRMVFYDIPEDHKIARNALVQKLRMLSFYQLQKSVWVHPFPCRESIEKICSYYEIDSYVSYIETGFIDNQRELKRKFRSLFKK